MSHFFTDNITKVNSCTVMQAFGEFKVEKPLKSFKNDKELIAGM